LIEASVDGDYTWLGVMIVIGSMISLAYYLRVLAAMWLTDPRGAAQPAAVSPATGRPALAGGSPEADVTGTHWEVVLVAVVFGAATLAFGIVPSPLFDLVRDVGAAFGGLA
jgi:NADH-quinone oxidoreductase subunit N